MNTTLKHQQYVISIVEALANEYKLEEEKIDDAGDISPFLVLPNTKEKRLHSLL